ncbi:MAG: hypothetical protein ACRDRD_01745, partial [Pseudonocardiaceae bacterium]
HCRYRTVMLSGQQRAVRTRILEEGVVIMPQSQWSATRFPTARLHSRGLGTHCRGGISRAAP